MNKGGRPKSIASDCAVVGCSNSGRSRHPRPTKEQPDPPTYCESHHQAIRRGSAFECSWDGCRNQRQWNKRAKGRKGFCRLHERDYLLSRPERVREELDQAAERINLTNGCWVWKLSEREIIDGLRPRLSFGYSWLAYRFFYVLMRGPLKAGQTLDHLCGDRACVAPHHLQPVSTQENKRRQSERVQHKRNRTQDIVANCEALKADKRFMAEALGFFMALKGVTPVLADARAQLFHYTPRPIQPRNQVIREMAYYRKD